MELQDARYSKIRLIFDEAEHKYTDILGNQYISTTQLLHRYRPAFNRDYWLDKKSKELGISKRKLAGQWQKITDEACKRGSDTHGTLENGVKGSSKFQEAVRYLKRKGGYMITVADIPDIHGSVEALDIDQFISSTGGKYKELYDVFDFYIGKGYTIYAEIGAFLLDSLISGCIDVLCVREDKFVILDYKTNRGGIQFNAGYYKKDKSHRPTQMTDEFVVTTETLLAPVQNLYNCNGMLYSLQLSMYAYMVETMLGIPCAGLGLCHIDSDFELNEYGMPKRFPDGLYHIKENPVEQLSFYRIYYYKNEIRKIIEDRMLELSFNECNKKVS